LEVREGIGHRQATDLTHTPLVRACVFVLTLYAQERRALRAAATSAAASAAASAAGQLSSGAALQQQLASKSVTLHHLIGNHLEASPAAAGHLSPPPPPRPGGQSAGGGGDGGGGGGGGGGMQRPSSGRGWALLAGTDGTGAATGSPFVSRVAGTRALNATHTRARFRKRSRGSSSVLDRDLRTNNQFCACSAHARYASAALVDDPAALVVSVAVSVQIDKDDKVRTHALTFAACLPCARAACDKGAMLEISPLIRHHPTCAESSPYFFLTVLIFLLRRCCITQW